MNNRIKKKIKKKSQSGPYKFDVNQGRMCSIAKSYHEIKNERKRFHEAMVNCRHVASKLIGYSHQLLNSRRLRKAWKREFFN